MSLPSYTVYEGSVIQISDSKHVIRSNLFKLLKNYSWAPGQMQNQVIGAGVQLTCTISSRANKLLAEILICEETFEAFD